MKPGLAQYLRSKRQQVVTLHGAQIKFEVDDLVHTENSYKYTRDKFEALLIGAGFKSVHSWADPKNYFLVTYAAT